MDNMKTTILTILNRFRSPVVWASLGSLILWILKSSGKLAVLGLDAESFNTGWNLMTGVLIAIGIINNPESQDKF